MSKTLLSVSKKSLPITVMKVIPVLFEISKPTFTKLSGISTIVNNSSQVLNLSLRKHFCLLPNASGLVKKSHHCSVSSWNHEIAYIQGQNSVLRSRATFLVHCQSQQPLASCLPPPPQLQPSYALLSSSIVHLMKPSDSPSTKQKEEEEEEFGSSSPLPLIDPDSDEYQETSNHDDPVYWYERSSEADPELLSFHDFIDLDGEESQMKFKELEEQEQHFEGLPPRPLSPFDPTALPRRRPLNPSRWWLEEWMKYVDSRSEEWDRQQNTTFQISPPNSSRPASALDSSEEFQMKFKELEEQERRHQGLPPRPISPFDPTAPLRTRPLQPSQWWVEQWEQWEDAEFNKLLESL
jgi:hypothetical protein